MASSAAHAASEAYNRRIDVEINSLASGISDILQLCEASNKDKYIIAQDRLQINNRVANLVKAAESLLSLSADLKAIFLVNDYSTIMESTTKRIATLESQIKVNHNVLQKLDVDLETLVNETERVLNE